MTRRFLLLLLGAATLFAQPKPYFPGSGPVWQKKSAEEAGFDKAKLQAALAFAQENGSKWDFAKDQERVFGKPLGPLPEKRAATNVVILRNGYLVAEMGDTAAVDPVYSAAKSFLSICAGIAFDKGMLGDPKAPVKNRIHDGGYDSSHNAKVTWEHHLQQASEWEGEMWGKKSDFIGHDAFGAGERKPRAIQEPGDHYEYNDVRVNRFSLSLMRLFGKPLPDVLKQNIMDQIGASDTWRWHGYENSIADVNGTKMKSVPGGTRWGGGLWMNSRDMARVGLLMLRNGEWDGKRLLSKDWIGQSLKASAHGPDYGYLWWLNTGGKQWPSAPRTAYAAIGNGSNIIWVDPDHQLVLVWRWYKGDAMDGFVSRVLAALK